MTDRRGSPRARTRRPYTIRDQVQLLRLRDIAVSRGGERIVLRVERMAPDENALHAHLWIVNADGTGLRQLTHTGGGDADPVFAPDGRTLYYVSRLASGIRQVVALPLDGGEPAPVTASPVDVESFVLSRNGRRIAFAATVFPDPAGDTLASTARRLAEDGGRSATGRVHDHLFVRHWDEWKVG